MRTVELLIEAGWVVPMTDGHPELRDHSVAIAGGVIVAVLPREEAARTFKANETLELHGSRAYNIEDDSSAVL